MPLYVSVQAHAGLLRAQKVKFDNTTRYYDLSGPQAVLYQQNHDIEKADVVWDFFKNKKQ